MVLHLYLIKTKGLFKRCSALHTGLLLLLFAGGVRAQTPLVYPPLSVGTRIAPAWFGPNAFAVPELLDAAASGNLRAELAGSGAFGYAGDRTATLHGCIRLPLFTDRAALVVEMPVMEWWRNTDRRMQECRLTDERGRSGHGAGDVYVSTEIVVLRERPKVPGIALRAALRTASGGNYDLARYYDSPGYWFDLGLGKTFRLPADFRLRIAATAGFLCWQTDNGRQNDAVMYGARLQAGWRRIVLTADYAGYAGWEKEGDRPMVLRIRLGGRAGDLGKTGEWEPFATYQWGIVDSPWHELRLGIAWHFDVLGAAKTRMQTVQKR
ncbi:MAG: hypothetical protein IJ169_02740 [Paludibacteraceae bacterium]|nr:hypothetical protein [Paludibacteraceae bacterium]